jgi:copper resistance protein C
MFRNALLTLLLAGVVLAEPCFAHAKLLNSSPADQAQLTAVPKSLTLNFNEAAQLAVLKLVREGMEISLPIDKKAEASRSFTLPLPALVPGAYTVQWTAVAADDGHVTKGTFSFSIVG